MWCAAVANHLDMVKLLISLGADVNATSDSDSTPVRSACFMSNYAVVEYLISCNADIHKPNVNGGTCLINSVQSVELCNLLLRNNIDIDFTDSAGSCSSLHVHVPHLKISNCSLVVNIWLFQGFS